MSKDNITVKSDSFPLLEAFKKEAEKLGWIYNSGFTLFCQAQYDSVMRDRGCLYFSFGFSAYWKQPAFSLSKSSDAIFKLPEQWVEALQAIKQSIQSMHPDVSIKLSDEYDAIIDNNDKVVKVGCQTIPFEKVKEIVSHFKK